MEDFLFASSMMLATRHASMPPRGIGFLLLSSDEECCESLLVPIGQDDSLNNVADLASLSDRFQCHVGSCLFSPRFSLLPRASPPFVYIWHGSGHGSRTGLHLEGNASGMGASSHADINARTHFCQLICKERKDG